MMPSEADCERLAMMELCVSQEWLFQQLRNNTSRLVIIDCRSSSEFSDSHIRNAVNFSIPSIMLRRLAAGKIDLVSTIKCRDLKEKITSAYQENDLFVIYGDFVVTEQTSNETSTIRVLAKRLTQDGCQVVCLEGGFPGFRAGYPEWCESCSDLMVAGSNPGQDVVPLMGLRTLRISSVAPVSKRGRQQVGSCGSSATASSDSSDSDDRCDSSLGLDDDRDFPVEIVPNLFLGNAANSEDSESLARHGIQYILNVTPDLPNVFEGSETMKYMQIPIADHWSQNLASFFPAAIDFIDEARSSQKSVLVHCLAGVSRSVTVTVAYLMSSLSLSLNDAFNLVRSRKANIAPNFHFMEQLHNFERELRCKQGVETDSTAPAVAPGTAKPDPCPTECKCPAHFLSPMAVGTSPDSGIEFDRWSAAPPE